MSLISVNEIELSFGGLKVFDKLSFQIEDNERIALIGRNGSGKTTFLNVLAGKSDVDSGEISYKKGTTMSYLPQQTQADIKGRTFDIILSGLGRQTELIGEYYLTTRKIQNDGTDELLGRLDRLQQEMDRTNSWETESRVQNVITRMNLDPQAQFESLSGGQKRRVLIARAMVCSPEVLLLDEPTNHLDIITIQWLEDYLLDYTGTVLFVTHDRKFMDRLSTRIAELDRGVISSWKCNYSTFLKHKKQELEDEGKKRELFDKKLKEEEAWLRQGIKARRTRNQGRVKRLKKMRDEKAARRERWGKASFSARDPAYSGKQVILASGIHYDYDGIPVIKNFSTRILRGDKIGVIGPNGCGKTTLLRILLGYLPPSEGELELGTNLEIAYFDQLREQLDYEKSVKDNVSGGADFVIVDEKPKHIISYLKEFLFTSERAHVPVKVLSGGERNRLLLARLFTRPFNLLVMDEPTNDLDIETLELLEDILLDYSGTVIVVSHDREFLNNVVTSTIVFEEDNEIYEYPGGYDDWLEQRKGLRKDSETKDKVPEKQKVRNSRTKTNNKREKLSYRERQELEELPERIAHMEDEHKSLIDTLSDVNFYKKDPEDIEITEKRAKSLEKEIEDAYKRWEYLEKLNEQYTDS